MRGRKQEIDELGARLVYVGSGAPPFAAYFRETYVPDCEVYSDPSGRTYDVIGARRGVLSTFTPAAIRAALRALRHGFRQGKTQGKPFLQGGVLIVLPGDRVAWSYLSRHAGDHPEPDVVVRQLRSAVGAG